MADLYLVRHGQASFGQAVYDRLSRIGETQARHLGAWLAQTDVTPDAVATGGMTRHTRTAALCLESAGGPDRQSWHILDGLREYDHDAVVARHRPDLADPVAMHAALAKLGDPRRAFQSMYVEAVARWTGGHHDADYAESWPVFRARVLAALRSLVALPAQRIFAFTSGGPIMVVTQHLLGVPDERAFELTWPLVNTGLTRLRFSAGGDKVTLATYNAHPHLDVRRDPALVTYV